jgi:hypothetical protein
LEGSIIALSMHLPQPLPLFRPESLLIGNYFTGFLIVGCHDYIYFS